MLKDKNKDIVFLCQFFYPEYITSALLPFQTAEFLAEKGFNVSAITGYPKEYLKGNKQVASKENVNGVDIKRINYLQLERSNMFFRLINYFSFVLMMFLQLPEIGKHKVVIVYSNPPILPLIAVIAKKIFKTKIVFVSYDIYPEIAIETEILSENGISAKMMRWLNNQLYKVVDLVVALSTEMKNKIMEIQSIDADKIQVIENWATESGKTEGMSHNKIKDKGKIIISYLGNMGIPQDFNTIIEGLQDSRIKNNPLVEFYFAGHGNQKEKIKEEIKKNNILNVTLHGYLTGSDYESLVKQTDVFILTLKKELTGLAVPSKFYTYLLMNKYILSIISDETDIAEYTKKYNIGCSINNGDVESFVESILSIIENPEELNIEKNIYDKYFNKVIQLEKYYTHLNRIIEN